MDTLKKVTDLPLRELRQYGGEKTAVRVRPLCDDDIRTLLRSGPVQFVVADVGTSLRWVPPKECFVFWKSEAQLHLAGEERVNLDQFDGGYCYYASLWDGGDSSTPLIVLEKHH